MDCGSHIRLTMCLVESECGLLLWQVRYVEGYHSGLVWTFAVLGNRCANGICEGRMLYGHLVRLEWVAQLAIGFCVGVVGLDQNPYRSGDEMKRRWGR